MPITTIFSVFTHGPKINSHRGIIIITCAFTLMCAANSGLSSNRRSSWEPKLALCSLCAPIITMTTLYKQPQINKGDTGTHRFTYNQIIVKPLPTHSFTLKTEGRELFQPRDRWAYITLCWSPVGIAPEYENQSKSYSVKGPRSTSSPQFLYKYINVCFTQNRHTTLDRTYMSFSFLLSLRLIIRSPFTIKQNRTIVCDQTVNKMLNPLLSTHFWN